MLSAGSEVSVKRVITFAAFVLLAVAFILDLSCNITLQDKLIDVMEMLVVSGFTGTVVEKFAPKKKDPVDESAG